jgi:DNA adenine methylase
MLLNNFGERIKDIRESQHLSQTRLSELTGLVREQISRIENGQINPTLESIYKFSVAFSMPLKELMDFNVDMNLDKYVQVKENYKIRPFVKWAGGKTQLLERIKELMPLEYKTYYEPFAGGGALFLNLEPKSAIINDFNKELVITYKCFKDRKTYDKLVEQIKVHEQNHSEEYYYQIRSMDRQEGFFKLSDYEIGARFIYLNKACFNGLYRVNGKGYFNVPSGKKTKVKVYDKENFEALFEYLSENDIKITNLDFEKAVKTADEGDFVYFDPPYDTFEDKDSFTSYSKDGFGKDEQLRLANVFKELSSRGVKVMLSNHNTAYINELYKEFNIHVVMAKRMINSNANGRGDVEEVIITNY